MKSWLSTRKTALFQGASDMINTATSNVITPNTIPQFVIPNRCDAGSNESMLSEVGGQESDEQLSVCSSVGSLRHNPTNLTLELPEDRAQPVNEEPRSCPCSPVIKYRNEPKREFSSAECLRALVYVTQRIRRKSASPLRGGASQASLSPDAEQATNRSGRLLSIGADQCVRQRSGSESQLKLMATRRASSLKPDEVGAQDPQRNKSASFSISEPLRNVCLRSALEKDVDLQRQLASKLAKKCPSSPGGRQRSDRRENSSLRRRQSSLTSTDERLYLAGSSCPQVKIEKSDSIDHNGFNAADVGFPFHGMPLYKSQSQDSRLSEIDEPLAAKLTIANSYNGVIKYSLQYLPGSEQLKVLVLNGVDVGGQHRVHAVSSCVRLCLMPGKLQKTTTRTIKNTQVPNFDEEFHFANLTIEMLPQLQLKLKVINKESQFTKPEILGEVWAKLDPVDLTTETIFKSRLKPRSSLLHDVAT
ncbi:PREDICTED: C2 calcium-dependent domain-containing protein 4C-like [Priapulus caudatus]|uniref:C2 calcium-dependent domain-containing protein 4C-like n=1 Tax=Priapulus caudatus TaxID=37621 RepID=A0ABM1DZ10_PRICU|nr:PREDICTED: C2 calcium-dependent domain-containing protein 4C-like [Priapulus caudatus]